MTTFINAIDFGILSDIRQEFQHTLRSPNCWVEDGVINPYFKNGQRKSRDGKIQYFSLPFNV